MRSKDSGFVSGKWQQQFLERQRVPGTRAYQCPFCGDITGTEQQLENHLLEWCGRMPKMGVLAKKGVQQPHVPASSDVTRCQKCGRALKSVELADHIKELHTAKRSAQPQKAHLSAAEDRKHYREILLLRAKQLDSTPTEGQPVAPRKSLRNGCNERDYVPCSCGGSNENCSHCYGLGQVSKHRSFQTCVPPHASHRQRRSDAKPNKKDSVKLVGSCQATLELPQTILLLHQSGST